MKNTSYLEAPLEGLMSLMNVVLWMQSSSSANILMFSIGDLSLISLQGNASGVHNWHGRPWQGRCWYCCQLFGRYEGRVELAHVRKLRILTLASIGLVGLVEELLMDYIICFFFVCVADPRRLVVIEVEIVKLQIMLIISSFFMSSKVVR